MPLILLLVLTLGCSKITELANGRSTAPGGPENSNSASANQSEPAAGKFGPSGDARTDIERMADRFLSQPSFRAEMNGEGTTPMKTTLEFVSPDRYRLRSDRGMETIIIGKTTYMKVGSSWQKMPMALDTTITDMRAAFNKEGMKWFSDVKYDGEDTADGRPAYVYSYHNKGAGAGVGENDSRLWIAKDDGMPVKIEAVYRSGSLKKMTITYDYRTPVSIEAPVK